MIGILSEINKKTKCFFHEKGQGLVEFALVLSFCAAIGMYASDGGFSRGIKEAFDKGTPEFLSAAIGSNITAKWRTMDRDKLLSMSDNERRIKEDQATLARIGQLFIGKTVTDSKIDMLKCKVTDGGGVSGDGIYLGNYWDDNKLDADGNNIINAKFEPWDSRGSNMTDAGQKAITDAIAELLQAGFTGSDNRYFYSNQMVTTLDKATGDGDYSAERSIRVNLYVKDNKVEAVRVKINRGNVFNNNVYSYYGELDVTVKSDGTYKQTISDEDLSNMVKDNRGRIKVSDSKTYNSKWYK